MCRPATCRTCGKASYRGCGQHVEQILRGVPKNQRCSCALDVRQVGGFPKLSKLFGR